MFIVVGTDALKDGTPVVIVNSRNDERKTLRINASRFSWREVSIKEKMENQLKEDCKSMTEQLRNNFSFQEHVQIAFIPCILGCIAFHYGDKARKKSAEEKVSLLKPLSCAYDKLKTSYLEELAKDLDSAHIKHIESETARFMQECSKDFTIFWFSVHNEFTKKMSEYPYAELRVDAICGMLIIDMMKSMIAETDNMIQERIKSAQNTIFQPEDRGIEKNT